MLNYHETLADMLKPVKFKGHNIKSTNKKPMLKVDKWFQKQVAQRWFKENNIIIDDNIQEMFRNVVYNKLYENEEVKIKFAQQYCKNIHYPIKNIYENKNIHIKCNEIINFIYQSIK